MLTKHFPGAPLDIHYSNWSKTETQEKSSQLHRGEEGDLGCWEICEKPLPFTQNPLRFKPVGDGHKTLFHTFVEGD